MSISYNLKRLAEDNDISHMVRRQREVLAELVAIGNYKQRACALELLADVDKACQKLSQ